MSKSDTPRTDALLPIGYWNNPELRDPAVEAVELAALSRQLERELAASERRCAELQAKGEEDLKLCYREMDADSKAIEHLYSQIAGLEKDAERYRWLRDGNNDLEGICAGMQLSGSDLDAAIDAAIAAQEPSK